MKFSILYRTHRTAVIIATLLLAGGGVYAYRKQSTVAEPTRYAVAAAEEGTLVVSVSGTGQVATTSQVSVQPRVSGEVTRIAVKNGQRVRAGDVLVQLNAAEALKAVRDAETGLAAARLAFDKLTAPPDELSLIQAENALAAAEETKGSASRTLDRAYDSGFTATANAFLDLPGLMGGFDSLLFDRNFSQTQWNVDWYADTAYAWEPLVRRERDAVVQAYEQVRATYDTAFQYFKGVSRTSPPLTIGELIDDSRAVTLAIADAVKSYNNYLDSIQDLMEQHDFAVPVLMNTHQSTVDGYLRAVNEHATALAAARDGITATLQALAAAERTITERRASLAALRAGLNALDRQSQELTIKQREDALRDAREKLADYTLRAPFDGVVTDVAAQLGQYASGSASAITIITTQRLAAIVLNEVDAASVAVGQRATLTFDAIDDLVLTGRVAEVAEIGTVSQGVVSYTVTIAFDTQDERVKPGMSVSAAVATKVLTDVLMVPNAAVKTNGSGSYVEVLRGVPMGAAATTAGIASPQPPEQVPVEIGVANDSMTQVTSGLRAGDMVVVRTTTPSANSTSQPAQSIIPLPGTRSTGSGQRFMVPR